MVWLFYTDGDSNAQAKSCGSVCVCVRAIELIDGADLVDGIDRIALVDFCCLDKVGLAVIN